MDLEELRAFLRVVEAGSFFAAAESLNISRTTLRRRVASLESRAGVPLIETPQGIVLTESGRLLAVRGKPMVEDMSALIASVRSLGDEPSGTLRVVLPIGLPPHLYVPLFAIFRSQWPKLSMHASFSNDPLGEPRIDVDIVLHFGDDGPPGAWVTRDLARLRQWLVASPSYLAQRGTPQSIDDLHDHDLFAWQAPGEDATQWTTTKGEVFAVSPILMTADIHYLRQCALGGLGIAFIPDALLPDPEGELVPVLPDLVRRVRSIRFSVPTALQEVPKVKVVVDHIMTLLANQLVPA